MENAKKTKQSIIRTPGILGLGLFAGLSLYGYTQLSVPQFSVGLGLHGESRQEHTLFWNDRTQDLEVQEIEAVLSDRLPLKQKKLVRPLAQHILDMSHAYAFSPSLILAVIQAESTFRFDAKSNVGAMGLMQIRPGTAKYIAQKWNISRYRKAKDLKDPYINITIGVAYLAYLRERFENPMHYIAAYNLGPTTVGKMLDDKSFVLGKVTKYVTEIHDQASSLRKNSATVLAEI